MESNGQPNILPDSPTLKQCIRFQGRGRTINIPQEIGFHFVSFGILLLDDDTGEKVEAIIKKLPNDAKQINGRILQEWIAGNGKRPITWNTLIDVLCKAELRELAEMIGAGDVACDLQVLRPQATATLLKLDDLGVLKRLIQPVAAYWIALADQLGMTSLVPTIQNTPHNTHPPAFLRDLLHRWLDSDRSRPTLEELCQALREDDEIIGGAGVADKLEEKFRGQRGVETEMIV